MILACQLTGIQRVRLPHLIILVNCRVFRYGTQQGLACALLAVQTDLMGRMYTLMTSLKGETPTRYACLYLGVYSPL